jgi:hypothetical protein
MCRDETIIGHGQRLRQAHDDRQECMRVRRGICRPCRKTFTILPDWLAPSGHYSLRCRHLACERICTGDSVEQAAPHCQDPARLPDPSTLLFLQDFTLEAPERVLKSFTILNVDLGQVSSP